YFGVPLSNFVGWFVVGATTIRLYQLWDRRTPAMPGTRGVHTLPHGALLEPALYLGILCFNLALTFWIGERLLGEVGVGIFRQIGMLFGTHLADPRRRERGLVRS